MSLPCMNVPMSIETSRSSRLVTEVNYCCRVVVITARPSADVQKPIKGKLN